MAVDPHDESRQLEHDESRLKKLQEEREKLIAKSHQGFSDAASVLRLGNEIEALDGEVLKEKQRIR